MIDLGKEEEILRNRKGEKKEKEEKREFEKTERSGKE